MTGDISAEALTFLFTDLEGSTRLWEEQPDAMATALARHDAILREAIGKYGGHVFATMGDGMAAAFDRPRGALDAALTAQLALGGEPWGVTGPLRVRMGVHTGQARRVGDDYFGPTLNRCARLMGVGHGGQVLVSGTAADLVRANLPARTGLDDKGKHRLRDLSRAERIFQLTHPGLKREFPPLATLDAFPGNLPVQLTSFLGRDSEIAAVSKVLEAARSVTLVGVGGVGKTRLALHVAAEVLPRFPDGAWLCELAPVGDPHAVGHTIATVLSVPISGTSVTDSLVEALRTRHMLLVLDNCEHLLAPIGDVVEAITHRCPRVTVLATSREALAVEGERIWRLRPLGLPDASAGRADEWAERSPAVRLFVDRARAVRPDFALSESNAGSAVELCRRLDGVPLAIELAAARVATLSPSDIVRRLDDRFRLLTGGRRAALERQRTLRGTVEWSYELLTAAERRLFDRLSIFAGGCGLEAIEVVCSGDGIGSGEVVDLLDSLVGKSLIVAEEARDSMRYTMLETLRQYGEERLRQSGEAEAVGGRHARYFAAFAEGAGQGLRSPEEAWWANRLDQEIDNVRAAHAWAVATGDAHLALRLVVPLYPYADSYVRHEVPSWAEAAIKLGGADGLALLPGACVVASLGARRRGDYTAARHLAERALTAEARLGLPPAFLPRRERGNVALFSVGPEAALEHYEAAVAVARDRGDVIDIASGLTLKALALTYANAALQAKPLAEEALRLSRGARHPASIAFALYALAESLMESDNERALGLFEEAAGIGTPFVVGIALVSSTSLRGRIGQPPAALAGYRDLIRRWQRAGNWPQQWITLRNLVEFLPRAGSHEAAAVLYGAIQASSAPPLKSGPEAKRLAQAVSRIECVLGAERTSVAVDRGLSMSQDDVVVYALTEIDKLVATAEQSRH